MLKKKRLRDGSGWVMNIYGADVLVKSLNISCPFHSKRTTFIADSGMETTHVQISHPQYGTTKKVKLSLSIRPRDTIHIKHDITLNP